MRTLQRLTRPSILSIALITVCWNGATCFGEAGLLWHQERYEHRERGRGAGGEKVWRDVFTKDGYYLYDFTIQVHSVRGGGSEFAAFVIDSAGKVISSKSGVGIPTDALSKRFKERESRAPSVRIANDNTLVITGKTVYGTAIDAGGNVEYTVSALFIKAADISKVPGLFSVAGIQGGDDGRKLDEKRIQANIEAQIGHVRSYVDGMKGEARRLQSLTHAERTKELESKTRSQLREVIGWLEAPTLKDGLERIDDGTLTVAVEVMDIDTLRAASRSRLASVIIDGPNFALRFHLVYDRRAGHQSV